MIARKAATCPAAAAAVAEVVKNVTSAERSATLLVLAPSQPEEIPEATVAEVTTLSVVEVEVEVEKPGVIHRGFFIRSGLTRSI